MRAAFVTLFVVAACSGPEPPWTEPPPVAIDLELEVTADQVELLQPVAVQLDLFRRADLAVQFEPAVDAADFALDLVALPELEFGAGRWQRFLLQLRPLRTGELEIPEFVARAADGTAEARTEPRRIVVESVLAGHGEALEAPADPFPSPPRTLFYVGIGLAVVALGLALWWFTRRRPAVRPPAAVPQPAHVIALRALERLRTAPRATAAEIEAFYVEVSGVLRRYLENRFGLHAPERTTEEFLRELEFGDALARGHRAELRRFLMQCDLVKFARHQPVERDHVETFELASAFVESTRSDRAVLEVTA